MEKGSPVKTTDVEKTNEVEDIPISVELLLKSTGPDPLNLPEDTENLSFKKKQLRKEISKKYYGNDEPIKGDASDDEERNKKSDAIELTLERISALQDEIASRTYDESESDDAGEDVEDDCITYDILSGLHKVDAKTLGFIACAQEAMKYLADHGIAKDNPMVINLRNRLIEGINRI